MIQPQFIKTEKVKVIVDAVYTCPVSSKKVKYNIKDPAIFYSPAQHSLADIGKTMYIAVQCKSCGERHRFLID